MIFKHTIRRIKNGSWWCRKCGRGFASSTAAREHANA